MQSSDLSSSDDHRPMSDDASRDVNIAATTSAQNITGIHLEGDTSLHVKGNVNVTIGRIISKEEHWQNLISGTGQVQEDSAARLIDLACDDAALADKLKQLLIADATPLKLKQVILRAMKAYRWLERPPKSLIQSLTLLSQSQERGICFLAANILRTCSSLPEK
jgi:hypothetical protein